MNYITLNYPQLISKMQTVYNWLNEPNQPKTPDQLKERAKSLNTEVKVSGDLYLLNYEDDAPRTDQFVAGCRGTIWRHDNVSKQWSCVRATMDRFFNYGEDGAPTLPTFSEVRISEKRDGSLVIL